MRKESRWVDLPDGRRVLRSQLEVAEEPSSITPEPQPLVEDDNEGEEDQTDAQEAD